MVKSKNKAYHNVIYVNIGEYDSIQVDVYDMKELS